MKEPPLFDTQKKALEFLGNGKILYGGVGSGKSRVGAAYAKRKYEGKHIYVITTAKKRDSKDWEDEFALWGVGEDRLTVDSYNNIQKYKGCTNSLFIFDEQRLVGRGAWVKGFLVIVQANDWIMLTATPGDKWEDYIAVFIANKFYRNITQFRRQHIIYSSYRNFPQVVGYMDEKTLERHREEILVPLSADRKTKRHIRERKVSYNKDLFFKAAKGRQDPTTGEPFKSVTEMVYFLRKVSNSDPSRIEALKLVLRQHRRVIVFYNFDYELETLRGTEFGCPVAEWNGHRHEPIPDGEDWVYLVQYTSGAEGWNCVRTDAILFYSLSYSYRMFEQAKGRIDRINTNYVDLYYYILSSGSPIDQSIYRALRDKKSFNERIFGRIFWPPEGVTNVKEVND